MVVFYVYHYVRAQSMCLRSLLLKSNVLLCFLWAKGLNANDIHKEMIPGYGRKCMWRKEVAL
jgi:hypothetical protein